MRHTSWGGNGDTQLGCGEWVQGSGSNQEAEAAASMWLQSGALYPSTIPDCAQSIGKILFFFVVSEKCHALHLCGAHRNILG